MPDAPGNVVTIPSSTENRTEVHSSSRSGAPGPEVMSRTGLSSEYFATLRLREGQTQMDGAEVHSLRAV